MWFNKKKVDNKPKHREVDYATYKALLRIQTKDEKQICMDYVKTLPEHECDPIREFIENSYSAGVIHVRDNAHKIIRMISTNHIKEINYTPVITIETIKELIPVNLGGK